MSGFPGGSHAGSLRFPAELLIQDKNRTRISEGGIYARGGKIARGATGDRKHRFGKDGVRLGADVFSDATGQSRSDQKPGIKDTKLLESTRKNISTGEFVGSQTNEGRRKKTTKQK